jgi:hypothetical protein
MSCKSSKYDATIRNKLFFISSFLRIQMPLHGVFLHKALKLVTIVGDVNKAWRF